MKKFLKKLKAFFLRFEYVRCTPNMSIIIPFSSRDPDRIKNFNWLLKYLKCELPDAEIIIGRSKGSVFCKGEALNNAVKRSNGKVIVILDADAYIEGKNIRICVDRILESMSHGHRLWYIPYRNLYRLTKCITEDIINSDPCDPIRLSRHPPKDWLDGNGHKSKYGHRYAAMCAIFPREAYDIIRCFDERFEGWGGEDVALLRALDTLYARHKTLKASIYHLWHSFIGSDYKTRRWEGQRSGGANDRLANMYNKATRNPTQMRKLIDDGYEYTKNKKKWWKRKRGN